MGGSRLGIGLSAPGLRSGGFVRWLLLCLPRGLLFGALAIYSVLLRSGNLPGRGTPGTPLPGWTSTCNTWRLSRGRRIHGRSNRTISTLGWLSDKKARPNRRRKNPRCLRGDFRSLLAHRALLYSFFETAFYDHVHVDPRDVDALGVEVAYFDDFFDFGDGDFSCSRHHRVEVSGGHSENQVSGFIRLVGFHQRDVGGQ